MVDKKFILAGKAIFTIHNDKGDHYTYRVQAKKDRNDKTKKIYFVGLLTGPNNTRDYTYIGMLNADTFKAFPTAKSKFAKDSMAFKVLNWGLLVINQNAHQNLPPNYGIKHEGRCCRCARKLTTPESIDSGIGPECIKIMNKGIDV
jgi:hypothetical protein